MNLHGMQVTHKKFGNGSILKIYGNKMEVGFNDKSRTFIYPDSFEKFISINNKEGKEIVEKDLENKNAIKEKKLKEKIKRLELTACIKGLKVKDNSHAVFGMSPKDNVPLDVFETGVMSTGKFASGKRKGDPRIPKNLQMNSALILTMRCEGTKETKRNIIGIAMVPERFNGEECSDGYIEAHPYYRVKWEPEEENLYFWNYFSDGKKRKSWGLSEMKYVRCEVVRHILKDMYDLTLDYEKKNLLKEFMEYFDDLNGLS